MSSLYTTKKCSELIPGDIILHPVFRPDGLLFIKKYKRITPSIIMHLRKQFPLFYPFLVVESDEKLDIFIEDGVEQSNAYHRDLENIIEIHQKYIHTLLSIQLYLDEKNEMNVKSLNFLENLGLDLSFPFEDQLETIVDSPRIIKRAIKLNKDLNDLLKNDQSLQDLYQKVNHFHDVLLLHSVNSTFITFLIGLTLELGDEEMLDLTIASLFSDIGFTKFSKEEFAAYLNHEKSEKMVKEHVRNSVEILSTSAYFRKRSIIYGVYDHHEKYNGVGSPLGKKGEDIHLFGRIISIAQSYDELVGGYVQEKSILSFEAIKELWNQSGTKFDPNIFRIFIDKTKFFKVGEKIRLSNAKIGEIIGFKDYLHNPVDPIIRLEE